MYLEIKINLDPISRFRIKPNLEGPLEKKIICNLLVGCEKKFGAEFLNLNGFLHIPTSSFFSINVSKVNPKCLRNQQSEKWNWCDVKNCLLQERPGDGA